MAENIIDLLKAHITPELIRSAAKTLDESELGVSKALSGFIPTILVGLLQKSSDNHAKVAIFNAIQPFDSSILDHLESLVGNGNLAHNDPKDISGELLGIVFGSKTPVITAAIAAFSGLRQSSASALLGVSGPLTLGFLSKMVNQEFAGYAGLDGLLERERDNALAILPAGVGTVLGLSLIGTDDNTKAIDAIEDSAIGQRWLVALLLLLGLGAGILYFLKN